VAQRAVRIAYRRVGAQELDFPLKDGDIFSGATPRSNDEIPRRPVGTSLRIGWVMVPPSAGSGGHTTAFRAIEALERAGHRCTVVLYDRFDGDLAHQEAVIRRSWPNVRASVVAAEGHEPSDALVATSWQTAHIVAKQAGPATRCFYFVQDYEPYFYPRGAEYYLAEDTYRFGFYGITAGPWLAEVLQKRFGMACSGFEFGADTDVYSYTDVPGRDGIAFYAKRDVPRRGYALGIEVLREFARQRPTAPIHVYGDAIGSLSFPVISHGRISTTRLNEIYAQCRVGLGLSFTNVSLIPWELLACGVVPVVNDAPHNRAVLRAPDVRWAEASVPALVTAVVDAYDGYDARIGRRCADSVTAMSWADALATVVQAVEEQCLA
jgi:hypothetical protein